MWRRTLQIGKDDIELEVKTESTTPLLSFAGRVDASEMVQLLQSVPAWPGFKHRGSQEDFWHWRYDQSQAEKLISVIYADGKPISHAAALPMAICINGKVLKGVQWSDFCTAPEFRNQGLIEKAVKNLEEAEIATGIEVDFAFPSPRGYNIALNAGLLEIPAKFKQYELIIDPEDFFGNSKTGKMKKIAYNTSLYLKANDTSRIKGIRLEEVSEFPADIEELTIDFEKYYDITLRHSRAYLNHRYLTPEGGEFTVVVAKRNGQSCGYLVMKCYTVNDVNYVDIVDLCADAHAVVKMLLNYAEDFCQKNESDTLHIWLSSTDWLSYDVLRYGFKAIKPLAGERIMRFLMRRFDRGPIPENPVCHLVLGDSDWV